MAAFSSKLSTPPHLVAATPTGKRWVLLPGDLVDTDDYKPSGSASALPQHELKVSPPPLLPRVKLIRGKGNSPAMSLPPTIQLTPSLGHVFRFTNSSASLTTIGVMDLLGSLGGIGTGSTSVAFWATSFKILSVTVWPSASSSSAHSAQLEWLAGSSGQVPDESKDRSIPEGVTATGALVFTPPKFSLASFWLDNSADVDLFSIGCPVGSIIDLKVSFRLSNVLPASALTVTSASPGTVYYLALDGPGTHVYTPVGLPTTF